ncbi:uncharacterized protein LOC134829430 [Culicoides brevitarsis]|uniref:uncharacterized protein LOC134829430 n=1 Tax=Culicoides brevitarsis TaxID=469753 RepID=UPI00307C66D0
MSVSFVIYYLTMLVIYLEAILKELATIYKKTERDQLRILMALEQAYRKLEDLVDLLMKTFRLALTMYIIQDSYHLFADLYWFIFKMINLNEFLYWPAFVPKVFIKFVLFYGAQLCIDMKKLVTIRMLQTGYLASRHCQKFRNKIERIAIDTMIDQPYLTLCGYLNIDARGFLLNMSTLTLYISIFIQFIPSCDDCKLYIMRENEYGSYKIRSGRNF